MGHINRGNTNALLQITNKKPHLVAQFRIQIGQRFVQQQNPRLNYQRPRQRHTLLLPAGQLPRIPPRQPLQLHHLQHLGGAPGNLLARALPHLQPKRQIAAHRQVRKQRVVLKHHANIAPLRRQAGHIGAIKQNRPAIHRLKAGNQLQRRRLATAGRAEQGDKRPMPDLQ